MIYSRNPIASSKPSCSEFPAENDSSPRGGPPDLSVLVPLEPVLSSFVERIYGAGAAFDGDTSAWARRRADTSTPCLSMHSDSK